MTCSQCTPSLFNDLIVAKMACNCVSLNAMPPSVMERASKSSSRSHCSSGPATKLNPKGEPIPATDAKSIYMRDLMERDDHIGELARAKVDLGSSINEKRAGKILAKAVDGRPLPIQLKPYGTVTARWAGAGDKMNFQNLPRDNQIRDCLVAPRC